MAEVIDLLCSPFAAASAIGIAPAIAPATALATAPAIGAFIAPTIADRLQAQAAVAGTDGHRPAVRRQRDDRHGARPAGTGGLRAGRQAPQTHPAFARAAGQR